MLENIPWITERQVKPLSFIIYKLNAFDKFWLFFAM